MESWLKHKKLIIKLNFNSVVKAQQCYCHFSFRSVTLVGEKGRKILKEVVKQAKVPPKSRVISPSVIEKYKEKIKSFEEEITTIMKQEEEEKEVGLITMATRCRNERSNSMYMYITCTCTISSTRGY